MGLGIIAREMALDIAGSTYEPDQVEHLPGITNALADELSRRTDPSKQPWKLPQRLQATAETKAAARYSAWWRSHGSNPVPTLRSHVSEVGSRSFQ